MPAPSDNEAHVLTFSTGYELVEARGPHNKLLGAFSWLTSYMLTWNGSCCLCRQQHDEAFTCG